MRRNFIRRKSTRTAPRPVEKISTRIVNKRHWVPRNQLEIGMYVSELDIPWEQTRFMFQGFQIDSKEVLEAVRASCEFALVDADKIARVSSNSCHRLVADVSRGRRT